MNHKDSFLLFNLESLQVNAVKCYVAVNNFVKLLVSFFCVTFLIYKINLGYRHAVIVYISLIRCSKNTSFTL